MLYQFRDEKIQTKSIEYSAAYHCNLRCVHCSHLSPFMSARFPSLDSFREDLARLSPVMHAKVIRLLGGEPLLNPEIDRFVSAARESGIADSVMITTNGILLDRMSDAFWRDVDQVLVCLYPGIALKGSYTELKERAKSHGTRLWFQFVIRFRTTIVSVPQKRDWITQLIYRSCRDAHLFHCHMIHEGMLYKCAVPPFLAQYPAGKKQRYDPLRDGLAIHDRPEFVRELKEYLTAPHAPEACRYCLGYLGKGVPHSQLPADRVTGSTAVTRRNSLDYRKLGKETFGYLSRRVAEMLTGEARW